MNISNSIIYLIGFAGTGKLTIAKELIKLANFRLIDNHLINNPIFTTIQLDGITPIPEEVWQKVWKVRNIVLDSILKFSPESFNFIFTNDLIEGGKKDLIAYNKVMKIASKRKSAFLPVRLLCDREILANRIISPERAKYYKSYNKEAAFKNFDNNQVFMPDHPNCFNLDTSNLSPKESAKIIFDKLLSL
ncbi:MAG: hypothetical protein J0H68_06790 [Sphingobacteriia bacterium]|nr:hypothetical protein [Sphingobacteriia bacterium]